MEEEGGSAAATTPSSSATAVETPERREEAVGSSAASAAPANNAAKKKKKRGKKKNKNKSAAAATSPRVVDSIVAALAQCGCQIVETAAKGRAVTAKRPFVVGDEVFHDPAFSACVLDHARERVCHHCLTQEIKAGTSLRCNNCNEVSYCCPACGEAASAAHDKECGAFAKVRNIADATSTDVVLLKLAIRAACRTALGEAEKKRFEDEVLSMVVNKEFFTDEWKEAVGTACKAIVSQLPSDVHSSINADTLLELCCRINSNSHAIRAPLVTQPAVATGLFPVASLINHSCKPNMCYSTVGDIVYLTAIKPIAAGEELCISYIDLYQSRKQRQEELHRTKFFQCRCTRCTSPLSQSPDRFVEGFTCPKKACGGLMVTEQPQIATTSGASKKTTAGGKKRGQKAKSATATTSKPESNKQPFSVEGTEASTSSQPKDEPAEPTKESSQGYLWCNKCGAQHEKEMFLQAEKSAETITQVAEKLYAARRTKEARQQLEKLLQDTLLHPQHHLLFHSYVTLLNCCDREGDVGNAIVNCKKILDSFQVVYDSFPYNNEIANFYFHLGSSYKELLRNPSLAHSKSILKRYKTQAQSAFAECHKIRRVWYHSPDHPYTRQAHEEAEALAATFVN
ncbi:SET domain-containing protein [Balamuthia mandrillaris]